MPSLYTQIGPWTLQTFTLTLALGVLVSAWIGWRRLLSLSVYGEGAGGWGKQRVINTYLGALIGGAIGARLLHVLLNWDYFSENVSEAPNLRAGGLDWHGGVLGGVVGLWLVLYGQGLWDKRTRHASSLQNPSVFSASLRFNLILFSLTLSLPIIGLTAWYGCLAAGCGYGREVDTLANYSPLVASESVDVYGIVAPRFNTPYFGMALCGVVLVGLLFLSRTRYSVSLQHRLFWLTLALLSAGMFVIGFFRADRTPMIVGVRADQVLDMLFVAVSFQFSAVSFFRKGRMFNERL